MISVKTTIKPASARRVLREVGYTEEKAERALFQTVQELTLETHRNAVRGIQRGPATGRVYQKYNPRRTHQASAPGEYPMSDTGRLASSIQLETPQNMKEPIGQVYTNLKYGAYLEFKPAASGGRPWLLRAFNKATKDVQAKLRAKMARTRR